jgi:geranylgeranylglycerol-phosphate geranylgeranyltransferase
MAGFIKAYIKSMRLYYAFITGVAGWAGIAYYEYVFKLQYSLSEPQLSLYKKIMILVLLFLSWGINQIINDYLGLKEDRINAPQRPMVTGELDPPKALLTSAVLLVISVCAICLFLEPVAVVPACMGVLLNVLYEYAKGHSILGNIVFGLMIMMCTVVGYLAAGPLIVPDQISMAVSLLLLICVINGLMTFYTFFKDYKGDKAVDKKTVVVKYGLDKSRYIALGAAFVPVVLFCILYIPAFSKIALNSTFCFLAFLTILLQIWTGVLYFKYPEGEKTYYSLKTNFRACSCGQAALIALFDERLSIMLFIVTYMLVGFLFDLHSNSKA